MSELATYKFDVEGLDLISEEQAKYSQRKKVVDLRNIPFEETRRYIEKVTNAIKVYNKLYYK